MTKRPLSERQMEALEAIRDFRLEEGRSPSTQELGDRLGCRKQTAHQFIETLKTKGFLTRDEDGELRVLAKEDPSQHEGSTVKIPFLGKVPASPPTEVFPQDDVLELSRNLLGFGSYYALRVSGNSMIDANIEEGDIVIIQVQNYARNGQYVVAILNGEATLKEYCEASGGVILRAHNPTIAPIIVYEGDRLEIQGVVWRCIKSPENLKH